ncbi:MAG: hypothetical protein Q4P31_01130 [Andreesenia angusta]|nr:hypothetical protein [Andreesenia angusta]
MIYRLILVLITILSFAFFNNIFLKNMKNILFKTFEKTIIALILSTIVFLILGFMLEGPLTSSRYIITISDGILLGWIISLFNHIPNAK